MTRIGPLTLRPAEAIDAEKLAFLENIALCEREGLGDFNTVFSYLGKTLRSDGAKYRTLLQKGASRFHIALADTSRTTFPVRDAHNHFATGFSEIVMTKREMSLRHLYAVCSGHPTGSVLLGHAIQQAFAQNAKSLYIHAENENSRDFYAKRIGEFCYKEGEYEFLLKRPEYGEALGMIATQTGLKFNL